MSDKLKIDVDKVLEQEQTLEDAIDDYKMLSDNPFVTEREYLSTMNTDFLAKFVTMIEDLDDSNSNVLEDLEGIAEKVKETVEELKGLDEDTAEQMSFTQED